jgi:hypothetical protein
MEIWRLRRVDASVDGRPKHIRIYGVDFYGYSHLFRYALGSEAHDEERGFIWEEEENYWFCTVENLLIGVQRLDGRVLCEADITLPFLLELISNADVSDENHI